jgi:hypothetical protein
MTAESDAALQLALLEEAWDAVLRHWHDDVAREFAAHHLDPLRQESELYLRALGSLLEALSSASAQLPPG